MKDRYLRRPAVETYVGLSRSTIYSMMSEGSFPEPVKLGKRAVAWRESDVIAWMNGRESTVA